MATFCLINVCFWGTMANLRAWQLFGNAFGYFKPYKLQQYNCQHCKKIGDPVKSQLPALWLCTEVVLFLKHVCKLFRQICCTRLHQVLSYSRTQTDVVRQGIMCIENQMISVGFASLVIRGCCTGHGE